MAYIPKIRMKVPEDRQRVRMKVPQEALAVRMKVPIVGGGLIIELPPLP